MHILTISYWTVFIFGCFFIATGFLMLFAPQKANAILRKAGSTNLINYGELFLRMIPAAAMIIYADFTRYPFIFLLFGWFMIGTSVVLLIVPKSLHHQFSVASADILKPRYFQLIAPFSFLIGCGIIYATI